MPFLTPGRLALIRSCSRPDRRSSPRRGSYSSPPSTTANPTAKPRTDRRHAEPPTRHEGTTKPPHYKSAITAISSPHVTIERIAVSSNNYKLPADSVCLVALMVQAGAEHISGNSAGVPPPGAPETPRVAVADGTGESHRHRAGDRERGMGRELRFSLTDAGLAASSRVTQLRPGGGEGPCR